jgi:hypothetical protein
VAARLSPAWSGPTDDPPAPRLTTKKEIVAQQVARAVGAGKFVAPHAVQFLAQPTCTPLTGSDPGPFPPGRIIADVLPVSALKLGDPVTISVDVVANDLSLHLNISTVHGEGAEWAK